ncbi:MAG: aminotransferase class I/II-fold pyridoxal phosphate-dependent enzyme, partial [Candidatus Heimdallarchaeota archaeon]
RIKELHPAFNVNAASLELAKLVMQQKEALHDIVTNIVLEREIVFNELHNLNKITPYQSFTNFIMFKVAEGKAAKVQQSLLKEKGILIRNMSAMPLCEDCLRVTITTQKNNQEFISALKEIILKV